MNAEQWDATKAGDYFCKTCPPDDGKRYRYFMETDLVGTEVSIRGRPISYGMFPVWQGTLAEIEREEGGAQWLVSVTDLRRLLRGGPPFRREAVDTRPRDIPLTPERPWVKATDPIVETWVGKRVELTAPHTAPFTAELALVDGDVFHTLDAVLLGHGGAMRRQWEIRLVDEQSP